MLDIDVIEECKEGSSWSFPCILVPRADKSYRFVTDFRRVNEVTQRYLSYSQCRRLHRQSGKGCFVSAIFNEGILANSAHMEGTGNLNFCDLKGFIFIDVLLQDDELGLEHPVCYFKKNDNFQRNYNTIEKEAFALLLSLRHFDVYLGSCGYPIIVYTDHNPLTFIVRMKNHSMSLLRWALVLQECDLKIVQNKCSENVIAAALSRS